MNALQRIALLVSAAILMGAALLLLTQSGVPDRGRYTGVLLEDGGIAAPEIGYLAPPFEKPLLNGDSINLLELRGHPVVINFWATWCEPCRIEMPELQLLRDTYGTSDLYVLAVNLSEPPNIVRRWVKELGLTFDIVLDEDGSVREAYRLRGQPSTFIVSPNGEIVFVAYGPVDMDTLSSVIEDFITKP